MQSLWYQQTIRASQHGLGRSESNPRCETQQNKMNGTHPSKVNEMTAITDESIETLL
jgi:hypothetical protein